jgi:hypothetical protein
MESNTLVLANFLQEAPQNFFGKKEKSNQIEQDKKYL